MLSLTQHSYNGSGDRRNTQLGFSMQCTSSMRNLASTRRRWAHTRALAHTQQNKSKEQKTNYTVKSLWRQLLRGQMHERPKQWEAPTRLWEHMCEKEHTIKMSVTLIVIQEPLLVLGSVVIKSPLLLSTLACWVLLDSVLVSREPCTITINAHLISHYIILPYMACIIMSFCPRPSVLTV